MSQTSRKARFTIAMTGALVVVAATWMVRHSTDATRSDATRASRGSREPAGINRALRLETGKQNRLDQAANSEKIRKISGTFDIAIVGDDGNGGRLEKSTEPASHVRLRGVITADRTMAAHEYSWILPAAYKVLDGNLSGKIPDLQMGQTFETILTVDRGQAPLQPIVLHVYKLVNSEARGQVAQFDIPDANSTKEAVDPLPREPEPERKYVQ